MLSPPRFVVIHILARRVDFCQQLFLKICIFFWGPGYTPTIKFIWKARNYAGNEEIMRRKKDPLYQAKQELLREIEEVKTSLAIAHSNFDNVNDPDLVDSCIYEMTAIQYKYKYLLRRMRQFEGESTPMRSIR